MGEIKNDLECLCNTSCHDWRGHTFSRVKTVKLSSFFSKLNGRQGWFYGAIWPKKNLKQNP